MFFLNHPTLTLARELSFVVNHDPSKPGEVHEKFTFTCRDGVASMIHEKFYMDGLMGDTQTLWRQNFLVLQGLMKLPEEAYLLTYY